MRVTVAICTWNRASVLRLTLDQLCRLKVPQDVQWNVLVVNNNCTDETDDVVRQYQEALPLRLLHEPVPGKSNAANLVVRTTDADLILWTDDDVLVDDSWLASYVDAARRYPDYAFYAGTVEPWFQKQPPRWIASNLQSADVEGVFAIRRLGNGTWPLPGHEWVVGANLATWTQILRQYPFQSALGPREGVPRNGEETDVINRLRRDGHSGLWVGGAKVRHFVPEGRMTSAYFWVWHRWAGWVAAHNWEDKGKLLWGAPRWLWRSYPQNLLVATLLWPIRGKWWFKAFVRAAKSKGMLDRFLEAEGGPRPRG